MKTFRLRLVATIPLLGLWGTGCDSTPTTTLKDTYSDRFLIGVAIQDSPLLGNDPTALALIEREFNSLTPENLLKWEMVHPAPGRYDLEPAERLVEFGERHGMFVVGHVLVWHQQTPKWVFRDGDRPVSAETLRATLKDHIETVVGTFRERIQGWDVINEALLDDGTLRPTPWLEILGEDYLGLAFAEAHRVDPTAKLYYNDYNLWKPAKREGAVRMLMKLLEAGVPVHGIGMQGHWGLESPTLKDVRDSIEAFAAIGLEVHITEMDIHVIPNPWDFEGADIAADFELQAQLNPYVDGLPKAVAAAQARRYRALFDLFLEYPETVKRVTLWGLTDGVSWRNDWPIKGRTAYPLLFDRNYEPKPAYQALLEE